MDPHIDDAGPTPGQEFDLRPPSLGFCTRRKEVVREVDCLTCYTGLRSRPSRRMRCVEANIEVPAKMAERDALVLRIAPMLDALDAEDLRAVARNIFECACAHPEEATSKIFFAQVEAHAAQREIAEIALK